MQIINRNNYEEYFLLYADDELNTASRLAVENFVQQNPDLAIEFNMLLQTKSVADEAIFFDKEILLRTEGDSINETNHQEYFLLYIDNELSITKRAEVEMYVLQHPKFQDEFTTLKQAVLAPEIINYDHKKNLYRAEKRRIVFLKPWRLAAAAIFIGVCAIGWWVIQKNATTITVAANHSAQHQPKQNTVVAKPDDSIKQVIQQPEQITAQQQSSIKNEQEVRTETAIVKKKKENINNVIDENKNDEAPQAVTRHSVITNNDIANNEKQPPVETPNITDAPEHISEQQNDVTALQTPAETKNNNYNIYPVAYKELNTNDDDNSLHVGMLDLNKAKVKNLFRKAGRVFGNKSKDANEDGKLQVANFEIDTKKQ